MSCTSTKEASPIEQETPPIVETEEPEVVEESDNIPTEEELRRGKLTEIYKTELNEKYNADANSLATFYIQAQQKFYTGEYQSALFFIDRAVEIKETADILALKGSIYLGLGSREAFVENWRKALTLDANVPIPPSPIIIRFLKETGLVNENLQKNF